MNNTTSAPSGPKRPPLRGWANGMAGMLLIAFALSLGACRPGSGQGLDENGNLLTDSDAGGGDAGLPGASGNANATLDWIQTNVWGPICTVCHGGVSPSVGLSWEAGSSCANVGRTSTEIAAMMEIATGDPDNSYMIWKVEGNAEIVGGQMPLNGSPLPAATIQNMRDWIGDGTLGC